MPTIGGWPGGSLSPGASSERSTASTEQKRELDAKVTALVRTRFGGACPAAFTHYDADGNGTIDKDERKALLSDAGIGSGLTPWAWANGIIETVDEDGGSAWAEFEAVFEGRRT